VKELQDRLAVNETPVFYFTRYSLVAKPIIEKGSDASGEYDEEPPG